MLIRTQLPSGWSHSHCFRSNFCSEIIVPDLLLSRMPSSLWEQATEQSCTRNCYSQLCHQHLVAFAHVSFSCLEAFTTQGYPGRSWISSKTHWRPVRSIPSIPAGIWQYQSTLYTFKSASRKAQQKSRRHIIQYWITNPQIYKDTFLLH